jgi:hypothetical protein
MPAIMLECKECGDDIEPGDEQRCGECMAEPLCEECFENHECDVEEDEEEE